MFYKSKEDDKDMSSITNWGKVGTLVEVGENWIWRSTTFNRLVITQDGYVVYLKETYPVDGDSLELFRKFPDKDIDKYIKKNPEQVLVRHNVNLAENIITFAFHSDKTQYDHFRESVISIPQVMSCAGCDGSNGVISFMDDTIRTHGKFLIHNIQYLFRGDIADKCEDPSILNLYVKGLVKLADTFINISRAVMQTDIKKDQVPQNLTVDQAKERICYKLLGSSLKEAQSVKNFLLNDNPKVTYFNNIEWFKNKYYNE
jgi:hypothetical protein